MLCVSDLASWVDDLSIVELVRVIFIFFGLLSLVFVLGK